MSELHANARAPRELLDEDELRNWYDLPAVQARHQAHDRRRHELYAQLNAALDAHGQYRLGELSDLGHDEALVAEDELLFVVGTLCVLNGQRALWSKIHRLFADRDEEPTESASAFLERMTRENHSDVVWRVLGPWRDWDTWTTA